MDFSLPSVFPVNTNTGGIPTSTAGIVTAYGIGGAIIAEAVSSDGTIQTATATFNCPLVSSDSHDRRQLLSRFTGAFPAGDGNCL